MTVWELIAALKQMNPNDAVHLEIREPYDDEAATLREQVTEVTATEDGVVLS